MNEEGKMILYKQLMKFEVMSKIKDVKLISWEKFLSLDKKETLEYASDYRDRCSELFNKIAKKSERRPLYLELPDMDFEGIDLSDFYLHDFMPGYAKEKSSGKKIFVTTKVNLKDTNCLINMGTIRPIIISLDGKTIKEISADIRKCDFRGCTVFGKFQNTRAKLEFNQDNLPKEYIQRLNDFKVPNDCVPATDDVYIAMIDGNILRGMSGLDKVKQMVDYNLVNLKERIWKYRTVIRDYKIDISYTGAFLYQYGLESIGKENYYIDLDGRAREAYLQGDLDFVEVVFKDLDKETKRSIVSLALKDGREKFVSRHKKELRGVQKRYFEAKGTRGVVVEQTGKLKDELILEYNDKKFVELEIDLMRAELSVRDDLIREIYYRGDLSFVQKYLTAISKGLKCEIFGKEYDKKNFDFVYKNFDKMEECEIKKSIIKKEFRDNNYKFLYEKYLYIQDKELKERIMAHAYKEENIDFLNKFIDEMPKSMKLEAAIKFKDLKLSKAEKISLLKK